MSQDQAHEPTEAELRDLRKQVTKLQSALAELGGGIDAVVFGETDDQRIYTSGGADRAPRVLVEHMGEGAATVSEGGVILYANPTLAGFFGVRREEMAGRDLADFLDVEDLPAVARLLARDAGRDRREEITVCQEHGRTIPLLVVATDLDVDGVMMRCLVFTDLSLQKAVERQSALDAARTERQQVAREVNDTIVQGLVAAEMALDLGQVDLARSVVGRTSEHARHWIGELAGSDQLQPGMALRSGPAHGSAETA
jgi:PAS domain S-box-containing protein